MTFESHRVAKVVLNVALVLVLSAPARAADPPALPLPPIQYDPDHVPKFDWVQIDSGEWLKGEIDRVERDELYFDSDEFDDVEFDWEDVLTLVSGGPVSVRVEAEDASGPVNVRIEYEETIIGRIDMRGTDLFRSPYVLTTGCGPSALASTTH